MFIVSICSVYLTERSRAVLRSILPNNRTWVRLLSPHHVSIRLDTRTEDRLATSLCHHSCHSKSVSNPSCYCKQTYVFSRDNSARWWVGVATRYGLDGKGIESWWGRDLLHPSRLASRVTQPPIQYIPGHSWCLSGRGVVLTTYPVPRVD